MDADTTALVTKLVWLAIGMILGYSVGVARTSLKITRKMYTEIHECHEALHRQNKQKEARDDVA